MNTAPLALSMGDPAGIGPEITVQAWSALRETGPVFMVIGDCVSLTSAANRDGVSVEKISDPADAARIFARAIPVLDIPLRAPVVAGEPSPAHAELIVRWIETGAALALSGAVAGLVTAPIAKAPLYAAGFRFPGHTEFLAELVAQCPYDGARGPVMMLTAAGLRVTLATIHLPISAVPSTLSIETIVNTGLVTAQALQRDFGINVPRLAVSGLNPHAGEDGSLGTEELDIIGPAIRALRDLGIEAFGPFPADTLFHEEARKSYDTVLCMYHDQALIPVKMLDFFGGVNVTLGLPIVRTSPDHGTAFNIAGRGLARADSLIAATRLARTIADRRTAA